MRKLGGFVSSIPVITAQSLKWNSVAIPLTQVMLRFLLWRNLRSRSMSLGISTGSHLRMESSVGRVVLGKDFDGVLGTGIKLYMNMGSNQGVKVGDYFRVVRSYTETLKDRVDSLSFKASTSEDTQMRPPSFEANRFTKT